MWISRNIKRFYELSYFCISVSTYIYWSKNVNIFEYVAKDFFLQDVI